ncbi:MAG: PepSY domain-containing protein [Pseudomonadota bacterium]
MKNSLATMAALAISASIPGFASADALEDCLKAAQTIQSGDFIKLEYLDPSAEGEPAYEIELRTAEGREWEFMCDAEDGTIFEIEQEAESADDPLFKAGMKVSLADAQKKVLALYPGEIEEVEYEIEANGDASYEMDVVDGNGTEFKVEVSAATGEIIEVAVEHWEIGEESDER